MSRLNNEHGYESSYEATPKEKFKAFVSSHVRLITFLTTVAVFLLVLGPIFVLEAKEYFGQDSDARPVMQLYDVITLSEQDSDILKTQLTKYQCHESKQDGENCTLIRIDIEPYYRLFATTDDQTGVVVYCKLLNEKSGYELNVLEDDLRAYFDQQ